MQKIKGKMRNSLAKLKNFCYNVGDECDRLVKMRHRRLSGVGIKKEETQKEKI
jgi:hypothetical protein